MSSYMSKWNPGKLEQVMPDAVGGVPPHRTDPKLVFEARHVREGGRWSIVFGVFVAVAWILFLYRDTAMAMVAIWERSETFAHGYLVAPISLWLVWRKRQLIASLPVRFSFLGLAAGGASGLAWLLAELGSVDSVAQFALVGMVISTVWALVGNVIAWALAFPLVFLFFCVPFGEFLFPSMMDRTADFIVGALRLSGIPCYIEGRSLVIPSGNWEVVEGCSGVRYLIASVVVGCLYAYLNYRSITRRVIFVALAVVAPVLGNWLRAYGIVLLGHVSGNKLATGVDHLIYGWVFFGVIMMALFWFGARWQEPEVVNDGVKAGSQAVPSKGSGVGAGVWIALAAAVLGIFSVAQPAFQWLDGRIKKEPVTLIAPTGDLQWREGGQSLLPEWAPRYSGMAAESRSVWSKDGEAVGVYVGYFRNQQPGRELITSENKVIQSKDPAWTLANYGQTPLALPEGKVQALSTEIRGHRGRLLVWHWYWIGGRVTSNDYIAKALLVLSKLSGHGDDSAVVMIYTPVDEIGGSVESQRRLTAFANEFGPRLTATLSVAKDR